MIVICFDNVWLDLTCTTSENIVQNLVPSVYSILWRFMNPSQIHPSGAQSTYTDYNHPYDWIKHIFTAKHIKLLKSDRLAWSNLFRPQILRVTALRFRNCDSVERRCTELAADPGHVDWWIPCAAIDALIVFELWALRLEVIWTTYMVSRIGA